MTTEETDRMFVHLGKVLAGNLGLMVLVYGLVYGFGDWNTGKYSILGFLVFMGIWILVQSGIGLIVGIILRLNKQKQLGNSFLMSAMVILVIGLSACFGMMR